MFARTLTLAVCLPLVIGTVVACSDDSNLQPEIQKPAMRVFDPGDTLNPLGDKFDSGPVEPLDSTVIASDTTTKVDTANTQITTTKWVTEQIHVSASDNPEQFMEFNGTAGVLWPGNVVTGLSVANGLPSEIAIAGHRNPVTVYLDIVSGDSSGVANRFSRVVDDPDGAKVNQAMNDILAGYKGGTPARFNYTAQTVYSLSQMAFDLGLGYSGPVVSGSAGFHFSDHNAKSRYAVRLTQQYFTMTMNPIFGLHGAWDSTISAADVAPLAGEQNPVAYISSVTYGRVYWLTYESSESEDVLEAAVNAAYNGGFASGNVDVETNYNNVMKNTTITVTDIGGSAENGLSTIGLNYDSLGAFFKKGAEFSPSNPGEPISYKVRYLVDGTLMALNTSMDYTITQTLPIGSALSYTSSDFDLFADSYSAWGKISYDEGGLRFALYTIDKSTGNQNLQWGEKCTQYCQPGYYNSHKIGYVPWNQDDSPNPVNLNWTIPRLTLPNRPGIDLGVECAAINYEGDSAPTHGEDMLIYGFDERSQTWQFMNANGTRTSGRCKATSSDGRITVQVNYTFKRNGQAM